MELPFGIKVTVKEGCGVIESNLKDEGFLWDKTDSRTDKAFGRGAAEGLESFLLALACAGVKIDTKQFSDALETAVESLASR